MKTLILVLVVLTLTPLAYGQGFHVMYGYPKTITLDGNDSTGVADTVNTFLPISVEGYQGFPFFRFCTDAVKASSATDSLTLKWRKHKGLRESDSLAGEAWHYFTVNGSVTTNNYTWADSAWYDAPIDFSGNPPDYVWLQSIFAGFSFNDSLALRLWYYDLKR